MRGFFANSKSIRLDDELTRWEWKRISKLSVRSLMFDNHPSERFDLRITALKIKLEARELQNNILNYD